MKTFGSILLIVTAFAIVMGVTYLAVNAGNTSSSNVPALDGSGANFRPNGEGERPEFSGESGGTWVFGMLKNVGVVAFIVALIALPKNLRQKRDSTVTFTPR